eukprot:359855-Chlamydomonas_euryale.AAC.5
MRAPMHVPRVSCTPATAYLNNPVLRNAMPPSPTPATISPPHTFLSHKRTRVRDPAHLDDLRPRVQECHAVAHTRHHKRPPDRDRQRCRRAALWAALEHRLVGLAKRGVHRRRQPLRHALLRRPPRHLRRSHTERVGGALGQRLRRRRLRARPFQVVCNQRQQVLRRIRWRRLSAVAIKHAKRAKTGRALLRRRAAAAAAADARRQRHRELALGGRVAHDGAVQARGVDCVGRRRTHRDARGAAPALCRLKVGVYVHHLGVCAALARAQRRRMRAPRQCGGSAAVQVPVCRRALRLGRRSVRRARRNPSGAVALNRLRAGLGACLWRAGALGRHTRARTRVGRPLTGATRRCFLGLLLGLLLRDGGAVAGGCALFTLSSWRLLRHSRCRGSFRLPGLCCLFRRHLFLLALFTKRLAYFRIHVVARPTVLIILVRVSIHTRSHATCLRCRGFGWSRRDGGHRHHSCRVFVRHRHTTRIGICVRDGIMERVGVVHVVIRQCRRRVRCRRRLEETAQQEGVLGGVERCRGVLCGGGMEQWRVLWNGGGGCGEALGVVEQWRGVCNGVGGRGGLKGLWNSGGGCESVEVMGGCGCVWGGVGGCRACDVKACAQRHGIRHPHARVHLSAQRSLGCKRPVAGNPSKLLQLGPHAASACHALPTLAPCMVHGAWCGAPVNI